MAEGKELPQWSVIPRPEQWHELLTKWSETDCEMRRAIDQFDPIIHNVLISQIRRYQKDAAGKLGIKSEAADPKPADETKHEPSDELNWEDVDIRFTDDFHIQITRGSETEVKSYASLGFEDRRKGERGSKPTNGWEVFKLLARKGGRLDIKDDRRTVIEKAVQVIRKKLRFAIGISGSPIMWNRKDRCYETKFRLSYPDHDRL